MSSFLTEGGDGEPDAENGAFLPNLKEFKSNFFLFGFSTESVGPVSDVFSLFRCLPKSDNIETVAAVCVKSAKVDWEAEPDTGLEFDAATDELDDVTLVVCFDLGARNRSSSKDCDLPSLAGALSWGRFFFWKKK